MGGLVHAKEPEWGLKLTGLISTPWKSNLQHSIRATAEPSLKQALTERLTFRAHARLRWLKQQGQRHSDVDLRELTVEWRRNDSLITIGSQQLNWGRMDILRVIDVINPVDQQDLFLQELPEAKLSLWMLNWEWAYGTNTLQVIIAPQPALDRLPSSLEGLPIITHRPRSTLNSTTYALRYGFEAAGWNGDIIAVRGWKTMPTLIPVSNLNGGSLEAVFSRQDSIGFSADKPIGGVVLRIEGLYAKTIPFGTFANDTLQSQRGISLGIGLDVRSGDWAYAAQAITQQKISTQSKSSENNAYLSIIAQRKWLQDRLAFRVIHIRETSYGSSWTSLQTAYEVSPQNDLVFQIDKFQGRPTEPFGSFANRNRVAMTLRHVF